MDCYASWTMKLTENALKSNKGTGTECCNQHLSVPAPCSSSCPWCLFLPELAFGHSVFRQYFSSLFVLAFYHRLHSAINWEGWNDESF